MNIPLLKLLLLFQHASIFKSHLKANAKAFGPFKKWIRINEHSMGKRQHLRVFPYRRTGVELEVVISLGDTDRQRKRHAELRSEHILRLIDRPDVSFGMLCPASDVDSLDVGGLEIMRPHELG